LLGDQQRLLQAKQVFAAIKAIDYSGKRRPVEESGLQDSDSGLTQLVSFDFFLV